MLVVRDAKMFVIVRASGGLAAAVLLQGATRSCSSGDRPAGATARHQFSRTGHCESCRSY
jgi:hypothetical protein